MIIALDKGSGKYVTFEYDSGFTSDRKKAERFMEAEEAKERLASDKRFSWLLKRDSIEYRNYHE